MPSHKLGENVADQVKSDPLKVINQKVEVVARHFIRGMKCGGFSDLIERLGQLAISASI